MPRIGAGELLVQVAVCGGGPTDIKKIQSGTVPPPRLFGHETAGTIVKIGGGNSKLETRNLKLQVGDRGALHLAPVLVWSSAFRRFGAKLALAA